MSLSAANRTKSASKILKWCKISHNLYHHRLAVKVTPPYQYGLRARKGPL